MYRQYSLHHRAKPCVPPGLAASAAARPERAPDLSHPPSRRAELRGLRSGAGGARTDRRMLSA
eukprot:scaffold2493_cov285-Prasinococcus_capsulatus_cf.AAC.2